MKRAFLTASAVLLAWCGIGLNFASAQFGTLGQPPVRRPAVSPYINLGTGGGGALSYYGIIRPQMDANRSIMDLQNVVNRMNPDGSLQGQLDQQSQTGQTGLQTGHSAGFFNYGNYYPIAPPGGGGTGMGGTAGFGNMGGFNGGFGSTGFGSMGTPRTFYGSTFSNIIVPR